MRVICLYEYDVEVIDMQKVEEKIGKLSQLLINNEDFSNLEAKMNIFNPLKILRIGQHELENLNVLSWLLTPTGNHHLGDSFLKAFIKTIVINNEEKEPTMKLSPVKLQMSNFYDAKIYQNWRTPRKLKMIDFLIISEANKLAIMLIHKSVDENIAYHLQECLALVKANPAFEHYEIIPVFLTSTGEDPPNKNYSKLTHEDLYFLLHEMMNLNNGQLHEKVEHFLKDYLNFLKENSIQNETLIQLSRDIYRDHVETIQWLLNESHNTPSVELKQLSQEILHKYKPMLQFILQEGKEDPFVTAMEKFLDNKMDYSLSTKRLKNTELWFYPLQFLNIEGLQRAVNSDWHSPYPVSYYFKKDYEKLKLKLEIGPFKDANQRMAFIKFVNNQSNYKINVKAFRLESAYTCIKTESIPFESWEWNKEEIILTRMNHLFEHKFGDTHEEIMALVEQFDWKIK
jgi:hypothetical protein